MAMSIYDEIDVVGDAHGVEVELIVNNKKKPNLGNENRQLIYQFINNNIYIVSNNISIRLVKFKRNFTKPNFYFVTQFMSKCNFYFETEGVHEFGTWSSNLESLTCYVRNLWL
jgi:hypothetical protein